jgi:hypothetical protein
VEVVLGGGEAKALAAVTGDEASIAWTGDDGVVRVADRASALEPFGLPQALGAVLASGERVALAHDGRLLYGIRADRRGLVLWSRGARGETFSEGGSGVLENVSSELDGLGAGELVSDVVVAPSDRALVFRRVGGAAPGLRVADRVLPSDAWSRTTAFAPQPELAMTGVQARRPTGLSADLRALYFFDEAAGSQRVGYFPYDSPVATRFADLGAYRDAQPNGDCTRLYFTRAGKIVAAPRL